MSVLESITCPLCGATEFEEIGEDRFRCNYCGATSIQSKQLNGKLTILEWVCPKCGFDNEKGTAFCGECGTDLTQKCLSCLEKIRWDRKFCPKCGANIKEKEAAHKLELERKVAEAKRNNEALSLEKKKREQQEKEQRQAREKREKAKQELKKKNRWKMMTGGTLLVILISSLVFVNSDGHKYGHKYEKALDLFEEQNWSEAANAFSLLIPYKDSQEKENDCYYNIAEQHCSRSEWTDAAVVYEGLNGFKDSQQKALECHLEQVEYLVLQDNFASAAEIVSDNLSGESSITEELVAFFGSNPDFTEFLSPPGMTFVSIPSGYYYMGSPSSEEGRWPIEGPRHSVSISSFELMSTEVTQGMWEDVMGNNPSYDYGVGFNYPVYYVSWNDCKDFIEKLNDLYPGYTYRLPSESEWEYACRAGTTTRFYWGDDDSESIMKQYCWYGKNADDNEWTSPHASQEGTQPVGTKTPNNWGLYDMSGNVYEWCEDTMQGGYAGAPTDGSAWVSSEVSSRVRRGGSWSGATGGNIGFCRSAYRRGVSPDNGFKIDGFRLARSVR